MVGIYKITNLETGECYIGCSKHIEKRWKQHFCKGYGARHSKNFQDAIDLYGVKGFAFRVIEKCDKSELKERERYWIEREKPVYNTVFDGHPVMPETREKISKSLLGRKQPAELVEKRKAAIHERHKTHPQTNAGHRKRVCIEIKELGCVLDFPSVKSLAEFLGVGPDSVTRALKKGWKIRKHKVWYAV